MRSRGGVVQLLILRSTVAFLSGPTTQAHRRYRCPLACAFAPLDDMDGTFIRLDKLLADRGAGSRKDVDKMIRKGVVEIDGDVVGKSDAKRKVAWHTAPVCDGVEYPPPPLMVAYHKPLGVVSSMKDDRGRLDLSNVLPPSWQKALVIGRLPCPPPPRSAQVSTPLRAWNACSILLAG